MSDWSANLKLPYMAAAQSQKHVTYNEALELLDAAVQLVVIDFDATTPPGAPEEGRVWALGAGATGAWAGQDGDLAIQANGGWVFLPPRTGWRAARGTELRVFDGTAWVEPALPALQQLPGLGIGTAFDAVNVLAVAGQASLFTGDTDGHQIKINKGQPADTASVLFQTGFSGRAEMGTAGDDDFAVKVSDNGTDWTSAIIVDHVTGAVSLPQGLDLGGTLSLPAGSLDLAGNAFAGELPLAAGGTGAASAAGARSNLGLGTAATAGVTTSPVDTTPGRVMTTGAAGWLLDGAVAEEVANMNTWQVSGAFRFGNSTAGRPTGSNAGSFIQVSRLSPASGPARQFQLAFTTGGRMLHREMVNVGEYAPWKEVYNIANILGTVSQSGGVPAGAIIQRGSNSNGAFVRFADGTQICTHRAAAVDTGDATWTFPASFVGPARATYATPKTGGARFGRVDTSQDNQSVGYSVYDTNGDRVSQGAVDLLAIGPWF